MKKLLQACLHCLKNRFLFTTKVSCVSVTQYFSVHTSTVHKMAEAERVRQEKEKFLATPIDEKRKVYACRDGYSTIADTLSWPHHWLSQEQQAPAASVAFKSTYPVKPNLNSKLKAFYGDITALEVDVIVNAANSELLPGGGVCGAIHRAAGPLLAQECALLCNGCPTGEAVITGDVLHTAGPMGKHPELLSSSYNNCLRLAVENKLRTIAFPCISTGIYGYPNEDAADVAIKTAREFLESGHHENLIDGIVFCLFLQIDKDVYAKLMPKYFPFTDEERQ